MCLVSTLIVLMWASCGEGDKHHNMRKPGKGSDEQDNRKVALKQGVDHLRRVHDCHGSAHA